MGAEHLRALPRESGRCWQPGDAPQASFSLSAARTGNRCPSLGWEGYLAVGGRRRSRRSVACAHRRGATHGGACDVGTVFRSVRSASLCESDWLRERWRRTRSPTGPPGWPSIWSSRPGRRTSFAIFSAGRRNPPEDTPLPRGVPRLSAKSRWRLHASTRHPEGAWLSRPEAVAPSGPPPTPATVAPLPECGTERGITTTVVAASN